jgi:LysR family glycine cleavage system transcriptional activator
MKNFRRTIPPLGALIAFEAAARHLSFTRAADELSVTQVAISRQIKALEAFLGVRLFDRLNRAVRLTAEGETFQLAATEGLTRISGAVSQLRSGHADQGLTVGTTTAFSAYWLMPRLANFRLAHPDADLRFAVDDRCVDLKAEGIHLSIRYGNGNWRNLDASYLCGSDAVPLCSPSYWQDRPKIDNPQDLLAENLIEYDNIIDSRWKSWFEAMGVSLSREPANVSTNAYTSMVQAVQNGQGIGLLGSPIVDDLVTSGALIAPTTAARWKLPGAYYVVTPKAHRESPELDSFLAWLRREMAGEQPAAH